MAVRKTVFTQSDAHTWMKNPEFDCKKKGLGHYNIPYETYTEMLKDEFKFKRENGILEARVHYNDGEFMWGGRGHKAIHHFFTYVGEDHDNEVLIWGGSGKNFFAGIHGDSEIADKEGKKYTNEESKSENHYRLYEFSFYDGTNDIEGQVFDLEIPTIGVWNGAMFHSDLVFYNDITLATEDAWTTEMHFRINMVPGDGIQIVWRELMGRKRFAYYELTGAILTARKALEYGMVNEILADTEACYKRGWEIAELIMLSGTRVTRRVTTQILRTPWKEDVAKECRLAFATEMYVTATEKSPHDNMLWRGAHLEADAVLAAEKKGKIVRPRVGEFIEEDEIK